MYLRKNQAGFGHLEIVLILLVIVLTVAAGWAVWKLQTKHSSTSSTSSNNQKVSSFEECAKLHPVTASYPSMCNHEGKTYYQQVEDKPLAPNSTEKYLEIKEWGVKFPLNDQIDDAYYVFKNENAYLSVRSLASTDCAADKVTTGALSKFSSAEAGTTKAGNSYYAVVSPQATCSEDTAIQEKADAARAAFVQAVKKIQTTN